MANCCKNNPISVGTPVKVEIQTTVQYNSIWRLRRALLHAVTQGSRHPPFDSFIVIQDLRIFQGTLLCLASRYRITGFGFFKAQPGGDLHHLHPHSISQCPAVAGAPLCVSEHEDVRFGEPTALSLSQGLLPGTMCVPWME